MSELVQLHKEIVEVDRVPIGERPFYELTLESHQRIVGVAHETFSGSRGRKTQDWTAWLWIESRYPKSEARDVS